MGTAATLAAGIGLRRCPLAVGTATDGSTIQNIAVGLLIVTVQPRTVSEGLRAAIHFPTAKRAPGNSLAGRAAIWPALVEEETDSVVAPEEPELAIEQLAEELAIEQLAEELIAQEAGISPAAVAEIAMPSAAGAKDTAARVRAPLAAAARRVWGPVAEVPAAVAVGAEGKRAGLH